MTKETEPRVDSTLSKGLAILEKLTTLKAGMGVTVPVVWRVEVRIEPRPCPKENGALCDVLRHLRTSRHRPRALYSSTRSPAMMPRRAASAVLIKTGSRPFIFAARLTAPLSNWLPAQSGLSLAILVPVRFTHFVKLL